MTTGDQIVAEARKHLGQTEHPSGSNTGPFVVSCQRATFLAGTGWPWCAAFVCKVAANVGVPLAYNGAGAWDMLAHHLPAVPKGKWAKGHVVAYNIGSGHTGIVTGVDYGKGTITSCDGNWSDSVVEHTMPISEVRGVWAIPGVTYGAKPTPAKAKKKRLPNFVVATSASGHRKVLWTGNKKGLAAWLLKNTVSKVAPNGITITRGKAK